jgi:putative membrane-bound dehydrogenase-like protein
LIAGSMIAAVLLLMSDAAEPPPSGSSPNSGSFPTPTNSETDTSSTALPPEEAARGFRVPDGFHVVVAAAEPMVQNPIAMAWDARGRLWIAENYTYADRITKFDMGLRDRVLILEDTDGDGQFDKRTVFTDDVQMLTSIAIGHDGVWLMTPPRLVFIPDRDHDDKPDGAPIVMLDGFTPATDNHHTFANGLKWGPDGWLYGRCGASSPGRIGAPGTPDAQRVPLFGGVWRYRPGESHGESAGVVEVLCHGTTNPWGMDWNEHGEAFFINTVNGHLWHLIPGAHFRRPHSEDPNPYVYSTIDTHADHYHWDTGKNWTDSRSAKGEHDRLGGGHAHIGTTIYLGDNWPASYRGKLLTLNMHGRRVNVERLEQDGAGYTGRHEPDMLFAADPWFRGIDLSYGPDGAVYILDWSDTGECHEHTGVHRTSGRIYRVTYGEPTESQRAAERQTLRSNLDKLGSGDSKQLVDLHRHQNEWFVRQARQALADRYRGPNAARAEYTATCGDLRMMFETEPEIALKLRALHTLFTLNGADDAFLLKLVRHQDAHIGAWAMRMLTDAWPLDTILGEPHPFAVGSLQRPEGLDQEVPKKNKADFGEIGPRLTGSIPIESRFELVFRELVRSAAEDDSRLGRLVLASILQRIPVARRLELAVPLASHIEGAEDHNLPLMVWYGIMPIATSQPESLARFAGNCRFSITRRLIARRLAELIDEHPHSVELLLESANDDQLRADVLNGLHQGLAGRHKVRSPANWPAFQQQVGHSGDTKLVNLVRDLSVLFGDGRALDEVRRLALDGKADLATRRGALQTLIETRAPDRRKICEQLLSVRYLNTTAVRGLTEFDDPSIGDKLAKSYRSFFPADRPSVIDALVTRPSFAEPLLDQIAAGKIPRGELTVLHARQIHSFGNARLTQRLNEVWGELRDSPEDKQRLIASWKERLTPDTLKQADPSHGRAVFDKICGNCHRLYGHGGQIGPDLTGSGRQNLDYVLINLIDPSAAVGAEYRMSIVVLNDGRVLNGIVAAKSDKVLTLQTAKERLSLELAEVDEIQVSPVSLMPDGLLQPLTEEQTRDLVAYLMSPTQVPLSTPSK